MKERIYKTLLSKYQSDMEDALLKIDMLLQNAASGAIMVDHIDITGEVDKLLSKVASASENMAILRRFYGTNQAMKYIIILLLGTSGLQEVKQLILKDLSCTEHGEKWRLENTEYHDSIDGNPKLQGNYTKDGKLFVGIICE